MLVANDPKSDDQPAYTSEQGDVVCRAITLEAIETRSLTVWLYHAVLVIYLAIKYVENIGGNDRGKRHKSPVLTQSVDAESLGNN